MQQCYVEVVLNYILVGCPWIVGSFSNDDGDGNEDVKKAIGLLKINKILFFNLWFVLFCEITDK